MSENEIDIEGKTKTVGIKYGETVNLGNYESKRMDVFLSKSIPENEPYEPTIIELYNLAKRYVIGKLKGLE